MRCPRWGLWGVILMAAVLAGCGDVGMRPPQMRKVHESEPLGAARRLRVRVRVDMGTLTVDRASQGTLYDLDMQWDDANMTRRIKHQLDGATGDLQVAIEGRTTTDQGNRCVLSLSGEIPIELELQTGLGESRVDLSGMKVETLAINHGVGSLKLFVDETQDADCRQFEANCGVGEMELRGLANLAPREFRLKGGIGQSRLDFSGHGRRDIDARVDEGIGQIDIQLFEDLGVRIRGGGKLGTGICLPAENFRQQGSYSVTPGYSEAAQKLDLEVKAGLGQVNVRF